MRIKHVLRCVAISVCGLVISIRAGTIVDGLNGLDPSTVFSTPGTGGIVISSEQLVGPEFILTTPTLITEIGAFEEGQCSGDQAGRNCTNQLPFLISVLGVNSNGLPDLTNVYGNYDLPIYPDPSTVAYEYVDPNLVLFPGTYYAIFSAQAGDLGFLLGDAPCQSTGDCSEVYPGIFQYVAGPVNLGVIDPGEYNYPNYGTAVRVLGSEVPELSTFALAAAVLAGIGLLRLRKRSVSTAEWN